MHQVCSYDMNLRSLSALIYFYPCWYINVLQDTVCFHKRKSFTLLVMLN